MSLCTKSMTLDLIGLEASDPGSVVRPHEATMLWDGVEAVGSSTITPIVV